MKPNSNLSILWILLLILVVGVTGLVWRTAKLLQKPAEEKSNFSLATEPAPAPAPVPIAEPVSEALPVPVSESADEPALSELPVQEGEEPLSSEELHRQIVQIFQEKLTKKEATTLSFLIQNPFMGEVLARGYIHKADNQQRLSVSQEEARKLLDRALALQRKNKYLNEKKKEREYQAWKDALPLNRKNLNFTQNAYGVPLLHKELALCPSGQISNSMVCNTLFFEDGSSSFVIFQNGFLRLRDDYSPTGEIVQSFEYNAPPPSVTEDDGQAARAATFYNRPASPDRRITFAHNGAVSSGSLTDTKNSIRCTYYYDGKLLTKSVYNTSLDDILRLGTEYEQWLFHPAKSPEGAFASAAREGTYEKNYSFQGSEYERQEKGSWTMNPQNETVTDKGQMFPSAASWGAQPRYCQTYPHDCQRNAQKLL